MAITIGVGPTDATDNDGGSTFSVTLNGVTAGNSLLVGIRYILESVAVTQVTCTAESNLTLATAAENINNRCVQWAYLDEVTTSGNKVIEVTLDGTSFHCAVFAVEIVGGDTTDIFDTVANATNNTADPSVGISTAAANNAVFALCWLDAGQSPAAAGDLDTGYNPGETTGDAFVGYVLDAGAAAAKTAEITAATPGQWALSAISLNVAGASPLDFSYEGTGGAEGNSGASFDFLVPLDFSFEGTGGAEASATAPFAFAEGGSLFLASFDLPILSSDGTFTPGWAATGAPLLPTLQISSTLFAGDVLTAVFDLPRISTAGQLLPGATLSAAFTLPPIEASATLLVGALFHSAPALPVLVLSARTSQGVEFSAQFTLPVAQLDAELLAAVAAIYQTWVLNTRKAALTEYDFQFNSYALFRGQVLAAGPNGIVVLGAQGADNAADIVARVRPAVTDFGGSALKRIPRIYTGLKTDGDMLFRTFVTGAGPRTYRLPHNHVTGYQQRRVPIGKGPKSRYWQFEWENENGADFSIQNLLVYPTGLRRRVM